MQIVSSGDNLHEMSKPTSVKNEKNIISLSSAEFANRVIKVNPNSYELRQTEYNVINR